MYKKSIKYNYNDKTEVIKAMKLHLTKFIKSVHNQYKKWYKKYSADMEI